MQISMLFERMKTSRNKQSLLGVKLNNAGSLEEMSQLKQSNILKSEAETA